MTKDHHHHLNAMEALGLFNTFIRLWSSGAPASLHLYTMNRHLRAQFNLGLGPALHPRPGAPRQDGPGLQDAQHPHHPPQDVQPPRRPRRRGPAARRRDLARREAWWARRQATLAPAPPATNLTSAPLESQEEETPCTPPPSTPDPEGRRIITSLSPVPQDWESNTLQEGVGVRLTRASSIPQLDGVVDSSISSTTPPSQPPGTRLVRQRHDCPPNAPPPPTCEVCGKTTIWAISEVQQDETWLHSFLCLTKGGHSSENLWMHIGT